MLIAGCRAFVRGASMRAPAALVSVVTLLAAARAGAATLTRGPYLQLLTTRSVLIVWKTDARAACSLAIRPLDGLPVVLTGDTDTVCAIAVEGLSPGAGYGYVPLADGEPLADESVFQADHPERPYTFFVLGDFGCSCAAQRAVRDRMLASAPPADFILSTGDQVYSDNAAAHRDPKLFDVYRDLLRSIPFYPTLGNHDWSDSGAPWRAVWYTPANNPARSENYYSFDFGNAHVAVINTNEPTRPGSAQHTFLDQDLEASRATWKFVAFHHTIYSNGSHGSSEVRRDSLTPLFDRHGVDVVFMGHDHDYERTKPLRNDQVVPPGEGTVYVTTGGGGGSIRSVGSSSFTAYAESAFHFTRVTVDGASLQLEMVRADGAIRDTMALVKVGVPEDALEFASIADAYVDSLAPATNFGASPRLLADASPERNAYVRFVVDGVGARPVRRAVLRLQADTISTAASGNGGRVYALLDRGWREDTVTYATRPAVDGPPLAVQGAVVPGQVVDFDVTAAVSGDGSYDFAFTSGSTDGVGYRSREASRGQPRLIVTPGAQLEFGPTADAYVHSEAPFRNFGASRLLVADASPARAAYLRFAVTGVGARPVRHAILRLRVDAASDAVSDSGGSVYAISDDAWQESTITYATRPAIDGPLLATQGAVAANQVVDFEVTSAVAGDGSYNFALATASLDGVRYLTREAPLGQPRLILILGPESGPAD
jgi:3',5'-cyclic AMP phosphodiesterase CpdA